MINSKTVRQTLLDRLQGDAAILKDFGDLVAFGSVLAAAPSPIAGSGLVVLIAKTAGACISAATRVITRIYPASPEQFNPSSHPYERFRVLFYVLCQRSYFEALTECARFRQLEKKQSHLGRSPEIDLTAMAKGFAERAAKLEEAEVRFHYSIDPSGQAMPLFEAYSEWLSAALRAVHCDPGAAASLVEEISKEASKRLSVALAAPAASAEWMRNYLALTNAQESSDRTLSELSAIRTTLEGWKASSETENLRNSEHWASYRAFIQSLPDQKESMYNEDFGVSKVFVSPKIGYHRAGLPGAADKEAIAPDLARLLGALVSNRLDGSDLIVLCGGPGSGKSTLCRILASELAKDEAMHPIFLKLRRCRETEELSSFVEDSLVKEGLILRLADLQAVPNVVLILDGFDELVLASRAKLRHFFSVLIDDIRSGPLRKARVIISGRDTLFPKGEGLPRGSHVLNVLSFDEPRIRLWGEKWRALHEAGSSGYTFHPELLACGQRGLTPPLGQLVAWPLTLHLLAKVHTAGLVDLGTVKDQQIEKAYLYRSILRETAMRQSEQTTGQGRLLPDQMRDFLRVLAWSMYSRSTDSMAIEDVIPLAKKFFPGKDEGALAELTEVAIVNAPEIQRGEETGFEFVHKSFSEYLVAELIARAVEEISHRISDIDGREAWHLDNPASVSAAAQKLGVRVIPGEVQEMLEPMLGSFILFQRGEKVEDTVSLEFRSEGLSRVLEKFSDLYFDYVAGNSWEIVADSACGVGPRQLEVYSNYGIGIVLIGAAAARRISVLLKSRDVPGHFCLEPFEGALWRWLMLVHVGGNSIDGELATRLYRGVAARSGNKKARSAGDGTIPIRIGLLGSVYGYESDLLNAMNYHRRSLKSIASMLSGMCTIMFARNWRYPPQRAGEESRTGGEREGEQAQLSHFLDHAMGGIEATLEALERTLAAGGFSVGRHERREHVRANFRHRDPVRERLFHLSARELDSLYEQCLGFFCSVGQKDGHEFIENFLKGMGVEGTPVPHRQKQVRKPKT